MLLPFFLVSLSSYATGLRLVHQDFEGSFNQQGNNLQDFYGADQRGLSGQQTQQFIYRPQRNVVSHQPLLNGPHPQQFSGVKRHALPTQQQQQQKQPSPQQHFQSSSENEARLVPAQVAPNSPWNLIDPSTGRNVNNHVAQDSSALLGLPADFFSGSVTSSFIRNERENSNKGLEYLSASGNPIYKMKKKYPLGYSGRRKRSPQQQQRSPSPWNLIDPLTGRTAEPDKLFQDQSQVQQIRLTRNGVQPFGNEVDRGQDLSFSRQSPVSVSNQISHLDSRGTPIYRHYKRYPYSG